MANSFTALAERLRKATQDRTSSQGVLDLEAACGQAIKGLVENEAILISGDGCPFELTLPEAMLGDAFKFTPDGIFTTREAWCDLWWAAAMQIQLANANRIPPIPRHEELHAGLFDGQRRAELAAIICDWLADNLDSANNRPSVVLANESRDKWIYEERCKGTIDKAIKAELDRRTEWEPIDTIQGIRWAAKRYAESHDLPPVPKRQRGRKPAGRNMK